MCWPVPPASPWHYQEAGPAGSGAQGAWDRRSEEPSAYTSNSETTDPVNGFSEDNLAKGSTGGRNEGWMEDQMGGGRGQVAGRPGCLVHPVGSCTCARETEALGWAISLDVTCFSPWEEAWVLMDLWRPESRCLSCPPESPAALPFSGFLAMGVTR